MLIERRELCGLIPHDGAMCLLDGVESWDESSVLCVTATHMAPDNPLRSNDRLAAIHGAEYGAQAMAVHGGLLARRSGQAIMGGYLAALRDVHWSVERLDKLRVPLRVSARQLMRSGGSMMYEFELTAEGQLLVSGRATVMAAGEGKA